MKTHRIILVFILLFGTLCVTGQSHYYYYKGEKQYLELDKTKLNITTTTNFQQSTIQIFNFNEIEFVNDNSTSQHVMFGMLTLQSDPSDAEYYQKINSLRTTENIMAVHPNYITSENINIGMSAYFYVKLKNASDYSILNQMAAEKNVVIIEQNEFMPLWYTLRCTEDTPDNTLNIANYFYEAGLFASSIPDFLSDDVSCSNDPYFSQLWGLNNTSNPSIDINACSAWSISQGNGIKVAVLDNGIELTHVDLSSNISSLSYDTETNTSPSQTYGDHGTHCAGTIGAIKDNNMQVVGIAPQCMLMSVSNSLASMPNSRIKRADGINWAWQNGADIISNSWSSSVQYDIIDEAIENALTNGRNGKGTIVVFASGNDNVSVGYPANSNPNIIAVGSVNINGYRSDFSNFGASLDVVAPGENILSTLPNNSTGLKSGTSMATPHVSGLAALILSVNPNLTVQQVSNIIESTAQKVGTYAYQTTTGRPNGTWNNQMGYGLVDAYAAVMAATLSGPSTLCAKGTYTLSAGSATSWSVAPASAFSITSSNSTSATVTPIGLSGQSGTLTANVNGTNITKEIQACIVEITGPGTICSTGVYTLSAGSATWWSISPSSAFTVTASNATSATVTPLSLSGQSGTLTAIVNGINIRKTIQACVSTISGTDQICGTSTYTLINKPENATINWQVLPATSASVVSAVGGMAVIKPLLRGTFTLSANITVGTIEIPVTKQIRAGAADPLFITIRTESYTTVSSLNYGGHYYLELYPSDTERINKYAWHFSNYGTGAFWWTNYSYPFHVSLYDTPPSDSLLVGFVVVDPRDPLLPAVPYPYPVDYITIKARFRDCMGWSPYLERTVAVIDNLGFSMSVYPNPASSTLHFDVDEGAQETVAATQSNALQSSQISGLCTVRLVAVATGIVALNQTVPNFESDFSLNVSAVPDGLYTLTLTQGNTVIQTQAIMIQH
jgi:subtilisin family serine protease